MVPVSYSYSSGFACDNYGVVIMEIANRAAGFYPGILPTSLNLSADLKFTECNPA